ncbi:response regulator [Pannus brasiliensis CCIBt3594]|uniref:Response regulator n=1 Tax=Pannus brasiliensis CCIBt3594 TaxID=1427578 RepID=A0AAW9QX46_9CHRO
MKILVIEDDRYTGESLSKILAAYHYTVDIAVDGQTGLELALQGSHDLIVLDLQLPKLNGMDVCRQLRSAGKTTPILILTSIDSNERIVHGLDTGADDYMIKPFDPGQLLARIRALSRRGQRTSVETVLTWGKLRLDPTSALVTHDREPIVLRPKEYSLLELFLRNPRRIFSREAILDRLWTLDDCPSEHAVTNLIKDLRQRLKNAGVSEESIETVYGRGYRLKSPPDENGGSDDGPIGREEPTRVPPIERIQPLRELGKEFSASLGRRIGDFERTVRELRSRRGEPGYYQQAQREAHRLAGSLGTFGYARGSETARAIEHLLLETDILTPADHERLERLLTELKDATGPDALSLETRSTTPKRSSLLLVGKDALEWMESLQPEASERGIRLETAPDRTSALRTLETSVPEAIVLDLDSAAIEDGLQTLARLKELHGRIPVLIVAGEDSLEPRVRAARLGSAGYLTKPIAPARLWSALAGLYPSPCPVQATVMIVDDDPGSLAVLTALFQERSIEVVGVSDPGKFWEILTATEPDLLLLDLQMPDFTGIELCKVARQDPEYAYLPILFVSSRDDPATLATVFAAGADDFIGKTSVSEELVTRALSHLERARVHQRLTRSQRQQSRKWKQLAYLDSLTRVANRRAFSETLQIEWQNRSLSGEPLALILCDIDEFKLYNDHYGHPAGDVCLYRIAIAIQGCLTSTTDLVARYGGEEFAIILPNTTLNGALAVAERIRRAIADLQIPHEFSTVNEFVTVSMGIAGILPTMEISPSILIETADQALYTAKNRGRNTYCLYR